MRTKHKLTTTMENIMAVSTGKYAREYMKDVGFINFCRKAGKKPTLRKAREYKRHVVEIRTKSKKNMERIREAIAAKERLLNEPLTRLKEEMDASGIPYQGTDTDVVRTARENGLLEYTDVLSDHGGNWLALNESLYLTHTNGHYSVVTFEGRKTLVEGFFRHFENAVPYTAAYCVYGGCPSHNSKWAINAEYFIDLADKVLASR